MIEAEGRKAEVTSSKRTAATRDAQMVLTPADRVISEQVAAGTLAPSQLSKRTHNYNAVLAEAFRLNPNLDAMLADSEKALLANSAFRTRGVTLEALPEILDNVVARSNSGRMVN
jgi:hypothetical protein